MPTIKAIVLTLDSAPLLARQLEILRGEPLDAVFVVDNGSRDATPRLLADTPGIHVIRRTDRAPGPGRNAGLDAAGDFDYVLLLDGSVRPLAGGVAQMRALLERRSDIHVIGADPFAMSTDEARADRAWPHAIGDGAITRNTRLSLTAYCLARRAAFDGLRFCSDGPFARAGWGVDDDEMCCQWLAAGVSVFGVHDVHPYRRASGSFQRLFEETGIWPNQYGSTYEERLVWCQQRWPQFDRGVQHGAPWLTLLVEAGADPAATLRLIKRAHDRLRQRCEPHDGSRFNPYSIVACCPPDHPFLRWAEPRRLRQHHGDTIVVDGRIVRRCAANEPTWTGDIRLHHGAAEAALRPDAHFWGVASDEPALEELLARYQAAHPARDRAPAARTCRL